MSPDDPRVARSASVRPSIIPTRAGGRITVLGDVAILRPRARPRHDFRRGEIVVAVLSALLVHVGAIGALRAAHLDRKAALPDIDRGAAQAIRVIPMVDLDSPLLKLGGTKQYKLPEAWSRPAPTPSAAPAPAARAAGFGKQVDVYDDPKPARPADDIYADEGHPMGVDGGTEKDPLKARVVDLYRSRVIGWFSARFRVRGTGLPQAELARLRAPASVDVSADLRVTGYSLGPSGNAAFDAAARAALEGARGERIPPPPEQYPDVLRGRISLSFVCTEDRCN
jgi:hypothetical protein